MGQSTTPKALALGVSLSLACGLLPGAAFADEAPEKLNNKYHSSFNHKTAKRKR